MSGSPRQPGLQASRPSAIQSAILRAAALTLVLAAGCALAGAQTLPLLPYPGEINLAAGELRLPARPVIAVAGTSPEDWFAASLLVEELRDIDHLDPRLKTGRDGDIVLVRGAVSSIPISGQAEGYWLEVTPKRATVVAPSGAGLFYGVETLRQMFHAGAAPSATITDWPALRWRMVQIDLSRGPMASLAALKRNLALLAELKINGLVLYFENTYAYPSLPVWAAPGGAITPDEARQLVAEAAKYHITIVPEQESFGHLHLGLQAERYQDLLEQPYGHILSPAVPASLDFIGKMFADLAPVFPSPFWHIGADETAELGSGRSAGMKASEGSGPLYLNYIKAIDQRLSPYHRKVLFWGDIAQAHPELLKSLPKDMIAVPWDYSPRPSFVTLIKPFTDAGLETWVAPGVANWSRIFPDYNEAIPNIANFVRDGRALGATGLINTNWNDDGESFFDYAWYGYAFGAAAGWEGQPSLPRFQNAFDWAVFRADGHAFADQIAKLTQIHALLEQTIHADGSDRLMWHEMFSPDGNAIYQRMQPAAGPMRLLAEDVIASLAEHRSGARRNAELLDPVEFAARRFDYVGEKAIYAHLIATLYAQHQFGRINSINGLLQDLRDGATSLRAQYRALWLENNTPYFLDNILLRYDAEAMYWQRQSTRFDRLAAAYRATHTLPPLLEPAGAGR